jgi:translation initiation factor 3 subunit G
MYYLEIMASSVEQVTRRIKRTLQKSVVEHNVAERKKWSKFGQEKGKQAGPDKATTTVGENVALKLSVGNKVRQSLYYYYYYYYYFTYCR